MVDDAEVVISTLGKLRNAAKEIALGKIDTKSAKELDNVLNQLTDSLTNFEAQFRSIPEGTNAFDDLRNDFKNFVNDLLSSDIQSELSNRTKSAAREFSSAYKTAANEAVQALDKIEQKLVEQQDKLRLQGTSGREVSKLNIDIANVQRKRSRIVTKEPEDLAQAQAELTKNLEVGAQARERLSRETDKNNAINKSNKASLIDNQIAHY